MNQVVEKARPASEIAIVRDKLADMGSQFKAALPAHIPVERFMRVVMTAIQNNGDLLKVSRHSLFNAAMKAAQDGLLPDSREGAIVPYKDQAQWMPMIGGLRKKARNSGEIATWDVHAVHENDEFDFELGDNPYIRHKPTLGEPGKLIAVYSVATLKSGEISRDVMSVSAVEKVRTKSRGKNTPWNDPIFYDEMAKKTVARRHSKVLPMSSDLDDLMRQDDALYDIDGASDKADPTKPRGLAHKLDALADMRDGDTIDHDDEKKSASASSPASDADERDDAPSSRKAYEEQSSGADNREAALKRAYDEGVDAGEKGVSKRAMPPQYRQDEELSAAWLKGHTGEVDESEG
ncbi:recombinase RecT [Mesorhizobium sp.]|uniref:recombinase RecT n=1 Tax=Mesorhizobium sp. TaxID=1871066 RepID=UPI0011FDDDD0|nr:recombinase RecT [Mesorhizobium sp.]TIS37549.1 MAG: recombinase RecT [Mesorhizobium sp.]